MIPSKRLLATFVAIFVSTILQSQTINANNGPGADYWDDNDSWVNGITPECSNCNSIVVPRGVTLIIRESVTLDCAIEFIVEDGAVLRLKSISNDPTILTLGAGSSVTIEVGGALETDNHSSPNHAINEIVINENKEWDGNSGDVSGYQRYPSTLPVELTYFNAISEGEKIRLEWETSSEHNNDYFTIERSKDGLNFEQITDVAGHGNSNEYNKYQYNDTPPNEGTWYYKLSQFDYDKTKTVFDVLGIYISFDSDGDCVVTIYPNPCFGQCTVDMSACPENLDKPSKIEIMDASGRMVKTDTPDIRSDGSFSYSISKSNNMLPGVYFIKSNGEQSKKHKKLILKY
ncbi:MAG: T9SS type A sorting domain-containing protein [Bacteroidales bacterium]|nr:T9SS type A sorting domain-containing protein [Bacteroidales bacterium]